MEAGFSATGKCRRKAFSEPARSGKNIYNRIFGSNFIHVLHKHCLRQSRVT